MFAELTARRVLCMLTNSDCRQVRTLYEGFNVRSVSVRRMINCNGNGRTGKEVIITNY